MKVVKANTPLGERLIATSEKWEGEYLDDVYKKWSNKKEIAWNNYYLEYYNTPGSEFFHICTHNVINFTVSWDTPEGIRLETAKNSYLVIMDE